ncbi:unnamed protein product [Arabis nemorensis]|uniref:Uncharacterized protein n=1 Tax=Arabis nemorensis TaxID=586526 RepID=A0A565ANC2_9BRAS|nr:unnamed protein product [Arabis nemorensis]
MCTHAQNSVGPVGQVAPAAPSGSRAPDQSSTNVELELELSSQWSGAGRQTSGTHTRTSSPELGELTGNSTEGKLIGFLGKSARERLPF